MPDSIQKNEALIIASQPDLGQELRAELESLGYQTLVTNSAGPARKLIRKDQLGLIVVDEALVADAASKLGAVLRELPEKIPVLLIATRSGQELEDAAELAPDVLLDHPLHPGDLSDALNQIEGRSQRTRDSEILGRSEAAQQIREIIQQIAPTSVSVLITGESGVGKNLVAEAIHRHSTRKDDRFLIVNCGAIPETLLESELFGHEKGAFTDARTRRQGIFEAAHGGTVFLDEIGEMSLSAQVRLLRVLDAHEVTRLGSTQPIAVDVRVIAATNRDLQAAVADKKFRQDLYQRLRVVDIDIPPLRSHSEDIPLLVETFVAEFAAELNVPPLVFDDTAMELLKRYRWPGNVRELRNLVQRLTVMSPTRSLSAVELQDHLEAPPAQRDAHRANLPVFLGKTPEESDRDLLYWAILEVARDVKELKAFLMQNPPTAPGSVRSLPVYAPNQTPIEPGTEIEYTETSQTSAEEEVRPMEDIQRDAIIKALRATGGHRKKAAELLEMAERTLYRKIQQYNL